MDETQLKTMMEIMVACHGKDAETAARKRANRCTRRRQPQWAAAWREVADRLANRDKPPPAAEAREPALV